MTARVLTVGETMALVDPAGPIAYGCSLTLRMAGAESNVAIALRRLGVGVRWVSRLGSDPLGDLIADTLAGEGVDTSLVHRDPDAPTGMFIKLRTVASTSVQYYRAGSAASRLRIDDVPDTALDGIELVHLTGITMALSASARETVVDVARRARAREVRVVFDPNWRPALWGSSEEAASVFDEILPYVDWVLCGAAEGRIPSAERRPRRRRSRRSAPEVPPTRSYVSEWGAPNCSVLPVRSRSRRRRSSTWSTKSGPAMRSLPGSNSVCSRR